MGVDVIVSVEARVMRGGKFILPGHGSLFEWQSGVPVDDGGGQDNNDTVLHENNKILEVHDDINDYIYLIPD